MEKVANGIWKGTCGRPEAPTPVSLRHQGIQYNGLDKLISHHGPPIAEKKIQIT
ncbi:hypothetical protein [Halalkalibacterium halodurans]|uniref:hypothetical protein n=1 Tax=Halalkalibacterium halodurans TaxID=86665 RepID=UPI002AAA39DE|nr:hypothetical protein [Halalkalibacterium halodurans]MDY7222608.1 hypothetical protein [Halalkalibacterium halodurans]MDY7241829.1 hypothetical protein [Halalkalibacterium halodurans]